MSTKLITRKMLDNVSLLPSEKLGAWFEARTQENLKHMREFRRLTFLRLYDTKSAGAYLPRQPGDFIVSSPNDVYLVECKASKTHDSLVSCAGSNISKEQAVEHFMWHRAGHRSLFLFLSTKTGDIEMWDGHHVGLQRRAGLRLSREVGMRGVAEASRYYELLEAFFFGSKGRWAL